MDIVDKKNYVIITDEERELSNLTDLFPDSANPTL